MTVEFLERYSLKMHEYACENGIYRSVPRKDPITVVFTKKHINSDGYVVVNDPYNGLRYFRPIAVQPDKFRYYINKCYMHFPPEVQKGIRL